jgi:DNA-binding MarR family transcriptional regulator
MILADNVVTEEEKKALRRIATESGFNEEAIEKLRDILLEGITNKEDEEILLEKFKKVLFKK